MNGILKASIVIILIAFSYNLLAQNSAIENDLIEKILEGIMSQEEDNYDYTSVLDEITDLIQNPIDINSASSNDLQKLYLLNQNQIDQLLKYRSENGEILSFYELQLIQGFSMELIRTLMPMLKLQETPLKTIETSAKQVLLLKTEYDFEKEFGYKTTNENAKFLGDAWKYYLRYQYHSPKSNLIFGFTTENDSGEPFFKDDNSKGFDFYSAHFQISSNRFFKQFNVGDYQIKFGQGVSLWSGTGNKKSAFTTQNARKQKGVKAYKSTDENKFFRGTAITLSPLKNLTMVGFASLKKIDASASNDTISSFASSIINTGLHRNRNELNKKDALKEKVFGAYLIYNLKAFEMGILFHQNSLSPPLKIEEKAYSQYYYSGKNNSNISFTYQTNLNQIYLFGEAARSKSGGLGILQGANISIHSQINLELIYRKFDKDFHSMYSNAFSEQSKNQNEEGIYIGLNFHPFPQWTIKAYYDQFEFPWLRYTANAPGNGHEYFSQIEYTKNDKLSVYFRYKQENKPKNVSSNYITTPFEYEKKQYRLHVSAKPANNWEIRNRLEFVKYQQKNTKESGVLIYQDIIYNFSQIPLNLSFRYALFDTDSYNTRIYSYENDILYAYSIPAYYNKGSRFYINLNYKINNNMTLYARYAQTKYRNVESIGSGSSVINGDTKSDIKVLLKFRF